MQNIDTSASSFENSISKMNALSLTDSDDSFSQKKKKSVSFSKRVSIVKIQSIKKSLKLSGLPRESLNKKNGRC